MARFAAGGLTSAGSTTLPVVGLLGGTTVVARIREIGVFNTTATAVALKLCRITTAGTPGATLTSQATGIDPNSSVALLKNTWSSTAPTTVDLGYRCILGAAIGSGFVWTFDDWDLTTLLAANSAIGVIVENGTGQPLQCYVKWYE
jgi:hypothetical protein